MANALRRIMIAEVPTLAIDLVEFHPLWDKATFTEDLEQFQQSLKRRPEDDDLDDDIVTVKPSDEKFVFSVEATGAMFAYEIVMSALKDKLLYLQQEVENGCCICNMKSKI
ncbi:DNA-directed RNA polymerase, RBP11-like dimerization domain containing protein [Nitzschia inconspicua]|uniref:DNA-directed RNA polymerase, RBP11-like dimerization domain containing protein n=1 Tax=Nitzschia inconspicua TaxID=303405 RepID=A0A9K3M807_9STRA|nr:DNA-directed RNA polymerase, RBP11-like dimerization domain containing protein [Nitzschia inconspicua]